MRGCAEHFKSVNKSTDFYEFVFVVKEFNKHVRGTFSNPHFLFSDFWVGKVTRDGRRRRISRAFRLLR